MKKIIFTLGCLFYFYSSFALASTPVKEIMLNIQFDSAPNLPFYDKPLHIKHTVRINPNQEINHIVMTQSGIVNNFPVTLAMLVKSIALTNNQTTLQFNLVHYGFNQGGSIITQPRMAIKNGQVGEMEFGPYKLKVVASWKASA